MLLLSFNSQWFEIAWRDFFRCVHSAARFPFSKEKKTKFSVVFIRYNICMISIAYTRISIYNNNCLVCGVCVCLFQGSKPINFFSVHSLLRIRFSRCFRSIQWVIFVPFIKTQFYAKWNENYSTHNKFEILKMNSEYTRTHTQILENGKNTFEISVCVCVCRLSIMSNLLSIVTDSNVKCDHCRNEGFFFHSRDERSLSPDAHLAHMASILIVRTVRTTDPFYI